MRKQEKQKNKKNNGITLIALVITIIVLLILAGVTIATLTGENGILTKASDASRETEIASVKEQAQLDIAGYVAENMRNGKNVTVNTPEKVQEILDTANQNKENKYYTGYTETGLTTPNGYEVPYEELYVIGSNEEEITSKTVEDLVAGEKVYYDTGNTSVGNQGVIECIVLYDSSSEYGVQIIAADIVDTVTLGDSDFYTAKDSYNNAITTLNTKAEGYLNTTYASDARCVGSVPNNKNAEATDYYTSSYSYMTDYNGMFKKPDTNREADFNQMNTLGIIGVNSSPSYWVASRYITSYSTNSYFGVQIMYEKYSDDLKYNLCDVHSNGTINGNSRSHGFRPVFTLKSGIKVIEGDGNTTPYTLGV